MAQGALPVKARRLMFVVFIIFAFEIKESSQAQCKFPEYYDGVWYHREMGRDEEVLIVPKEGLWGERECLSAYYHPNTVTTLTNDGEEGRNATILIKTKNVDCYMCMDVIYRSANILQYKRTDCLTKGDLQKCPGMKGLPGHEELVTMFKKKIVNTDCISSIEGRYQFSYEVTSGGGGICNSSESILEACQTPASPNYDNKDFRMYYSACKDLGYDKMIRYKCLGNWIANVNSSVYTYMALVNDIDPSLQEQYKCLITQRDQHSNDNTIRWGLSRYGDCRQLSSPDGSPYQIVLKRVAPVTNFLTPQCSLPRDLSGYWYTQGRQFASDVWINETHIQYKTNKNQFDFEETWFSCQAHMGTRYLMSKVVVGRCEINFVCYDIVPRHQSIVRYRVGRPVRLKFKRGKYDLTEVNKVNIFREACSIQWLTFARDNVDWKYEVLIQNPPSPSTCPIGGRFYFQQFSDDFFEKYDTRIRGVTERPRVRIKCLNEVAEFKSCNADTSRLEVDAAYCETVDYRARPIGEYEEPDHYLSCAGYWLEDMKSYLITYDEEDPISKFRCWVYERLSWTQIAMSRSETARCPRNQTATSWRINGSRFYMELTEQERLFDECPPRFDSGIDPHMKPFSLYLLDDSHARMLIPSVVLSLVMIVVSLFLRS